MTTDATSEAKTAFNLKVLRKHDPSIVQIVETASFVVLYNYNDEWTKTGVEGPMFLFRRNTMPYNGFFILNRNGVENFSADVEQNDDLEITPEFVIYRPDNKEEDDNELYGIWVFEPSQRNTIGQSLLDLQRMTGPPEVQLPVIADVPAPKAPTTNGKTSGKSKRAANKAQTSAPKATPESYEPVVEEEDTTVAPQINLDDLFGAPVTEQVDHSSEGSASKQQDVAPGLARHHEHDSKQQSISLLDSLFQKAASIVPFTGDISDKEPPKDAQPSSPPTTPHANKLLSLLGVQSEPSTVPTERSATDSATETKSNSAHPRMSELVEENIKDRIGLGDNGQPLTRREFVTELLSMIHTDPEFVTELHTSYVKRVN